MTSEPESLDRRLRRWLAPLRADGALPPGFVLDEIEAEQGITLWMASPTGRLRVELERADSSRPCFAMTRLFNIYYDASDRDAAADANAVVEAVVEVVREHEHELTVAELPAETRAMVREIEVDRGLVHEGNGAYYLNPYVGCMLGCAFCYASHRAEFSRALEGVGNVPWGRYVDVKTNLPEVIAREARTLAPGTVRMSPIVTDPYQPIERKYRITRGVLGALVGTGFTPIVLTRASLVREDLPLLSSFPRAFLGVSVPTDDDAIRGVFEPRTEPIESRLSTLAAAREAGLTTFAIIQPMLPLSPSRLVERLAPLVRAVRIGPLFERERALPMYRAAGRLDALSEAYERETFEALRSGFTAAGVSVNPTDPEWSFLRG